MNKSIIALAVAAGLAMPGIAAADMKIIGQAQLELVNTSGDAVEGLTLDDGAEGGVVGNGNASAIGVTGSHDVGNGMTALYKVNFNFQADDGAQGLGRSRDQFIGLKADFGTILVGRMNSPYKGTTVKWDPLLGTFMQARGSNGMSTVHNGYLDNVIAYANKFGEVKFVGAFGVDDSNDDGDPTEFDGDHAIDFGLNFPVADALELAIGYHDNGADDGTALKVGLKWKGDDMGVAAQFETLDAGVAQGETNHLYANFTMALPKSATFVAAVGTRTDESSGGNNDGTYITAAYKRALNKKVSYHAGIVMVDEGAAGANQDATQIGVGVRVKF